MVRKITILVSVLVVVAMFFGLAFYGSIPSNWTATTKQTNAQPSIATISNDLNTTLKELFPSIDTMVLTDFNFSANGILHTGMELSKGWNSSTPFSYILLDNMQTRTASLDMTQALMNESDSPMHVAPYYAVGGNKSSLAIDNAALTSPVIVVTHDPNGMYFVGTTPSNNNGVIAALNSYQNDLNNPMMNPSIAGGMIINPADLTYEGFTFIENYGWYNETAYASSGQMVLTMNDQISVYGTTQSTSSGTYYFVMAYTSNSAKGFYASNPWYDYWIFDDVPFYYEYFIPHVFTTTVNWETTNYAGQQLFTWGPQNSGSNAVVTYSVSAGISPSGPSASASISYGVPGGIVYSWADLSSPSSGIAKAQNSIGSSAVSGVLYTVSPTSVGELNPTLSGGFPPMLFTATFSANSQSSGVPVYPAEYTVSTPTISMAAY